MSTKTPRPTLVPAAGPSPPSPGSGQQASVPTGANWGVLAATEVLALVVAVGFKASFIVLGVLAVVLYAVIMFVWARLVEGQRHALDRLVTIVVVSAFAIAMVPLVWLLWTVVSNGIHRFDVMFFTHDMRGIISEGGGAIHAILGTIIITALAIVLSVPVGILAAVYLREYGRGSWLGNLLTFFVDVMTGIPSIVAGLFSYSLFAIFFGPGIRLGIMGSLALTVIMIPIVVRSTEEMLKIVPDGLREAAYALGVPKWRTIVKVVLPTALAGIVTGVMIAIARVIGETAPLLVTTGFVTTTNLNPFSGRMSNLPVYSYYSYTVPGVPPEPWIDRAWTAALVLVLMVLILYIGARVIGARFGKLAGAR